MHKLTICMFPHSPLHPLFPYVGARLGSQAPPLRGRQGPPGCHEAACSAEAHHRRDRPH